VERIASEAGVRVEDVQPIPHDIWPALDLPPLTFAQKMTLVLAGFGMSYELASGGSSLRLVPLPPSPVMERTYVPRGTMDRVRREIARQFPDARVQIQGNQMVVRATWETHQQVQRMVAGRTSTPRPTPRPAEGQNVYTLNIENKPVGGVAQALAKNLDLEIQFDPRTTNAQQQLISFQVKDATVDQLFRALLSPAGLDYRMVGKTLQIVPAEE
jgi:hypothetical protein